MVLIVLLEIIEPFTRLPVTDIEYLRLLIPLFVILGGALAAIMIVRAVLVGRLFFRILASFLVIVFIPIVIISAASVVNSIDIERQYTYNTLENITVQKEMDLLAWSADLQDDLRLALQSTSEQNSIATMLSLPQEILIAAMQPRVTAYLDTILLQTGRYNELFVMDEAGVVQAATNPDRLGADYSAEAVYLYGNSSIYVQPPSTDTTTGLVSIYVARPIISDNGDVLGVIAGRASLDSILPVVSSRSGLGETGNSYLLDTSYRVIDTVMPDVIQLALNAASLAAIESGESGLLVYDNHEGTPVVGAYRWLPTLQVALVTEMEQAEAFRGASSILVTNIFIALAAAAIAVAGSYFTVRSITSPLVNLSDVTRQVSAGNLTVRAEVEQEDEIGHLANAFNAMTEQLHGLVTNLEARVADRTRDLERRAVQLQVASEVARDTTAATTTKELFDRAARLIRDRFGFYHVGIFINDGRNEFAALRAAGGEAGRLMIANNHRLRIGEVGIVGFVARTGEPRIALDTGADAVYFRNPLLPYTRSEMALPLKQHDKVIGVLDVQSDKSNAFDQEDIAILQIMADQLAGAIEKTALLQEVEQTARELERSYRESAAHAWREFIIQTGTERGYKYSGFAAEPVDTPSEDSLEAIASGQPVIHNADGAGSGCTLAVPVKVRGQAIGTLRMAFQTGQVTPQNLSIAQDAADRLALALENARLVQDAQRLAMREMRISQITAQTQKYIDLDAILQNTIRELGNALGVPKTFIQIGLPRNTGDGSGSER
ncbi:MAG: HAMP domain-containing protein [Chloroflexi bacterium]|nr:HAMP domain-containing protein [Chloroflexota bacterium]